MVAGLHAFPGHVSHNKSLCWIYKKGFHRFITPLESLAMGGFPYTASSQLNALSAHVTWDAVFQTLESPVVLALLLSTLTSLSWTFGSAGSAPASTSTDVDEAAAMFSTFIAGIHDSCRQAR
jgi:hypothetical protein